MITLRRVIPLRRQLCHAFGWNHHHHRNFKYDTKSFLSDSSGARDFIALLGTEERRILYDELSQIYSTESKQSAVPNATDTSSSPPTFAQLKLLFLHQALPFIGFGFLDNLIMIVAGDYIDATIGVSLGISTMAAAGLGNALSDIAGIGSAWYVEQLAVRLGVASPHLSITQAQMSQTRWTIHLGRAIGVTIGCIIGMFPLLFLKTKERDNKANHKEQ